MKVSQFTTSEHADFKGLRVSSFHDGGFSMYAMGRESSFSEYDGHLLLKNNDGETLDPSKKNFAMTFNMYGSAMDFAEISVRVDNVVHPTNADRLSDTKQMKSGGGTGWYGGLKKIDDGYKMVCDGWDDGAKKAVTSLSNLPVPEVNGIESLRRTLVFADSGETLNIDQALAGNWEKAWNTCRRVSAGVSRVLSIIIPFGGNCDKTSEQLFWNGAQGMVITDMLEDKGYRVQLYGMHCARQSNNGGTVWDIDMIDLKRPDEPMRMDTIAAVVAHAGVFRTAGFCSILSKPTIIGWGLGQCVEEKITPAAGALAELGLLHPGSIMLEAAYSKEQAAKRILEFFDRLKRGVLSEGEIGAAKGGYGSR